LSPAECAPGKVQGRTRGPRGTRVALTLGFSAVLLGVIAWKVEPLKLVAVLRGTHPALVLLAALSAGAGLTMVAIRWHLMLGFRRIADRLSDSVRTALIGYGLTMVLPGAVFADVAKSYYHSRRHQRPVDELLLVCGLDRFAGMIGLGGYGLVIAVVCVPVAVPDASGIRWKGLPGVGWILGLGLIVAAAGLAARHPRVRRSLDRGRALVRDGWNGLRTRPGLLLISALLSVVGNLFVAGTLAFGLASVAPEALPWGKILWTLPVIGLAAAFPFTVAGAGAREGAAIALWSACGIPAPVAVAACLVTLTANLFWAALGGLLLAISPPPVRNG
jgi:uncharacterized membrane protein YbhN (UPF0104 family)